MRKNILFIINLLANGGTERQLVSLIKNLDTSRFSPHLCTLYNSVSLLDEVKVPKLELNLGRLWSPHVYLKLRMLKRFIEEHEIDLVQTFFQDAFFLSALLKPFLEFKLVGSFRDMGFWKTPSSSLKMKMSYPFFDGFIANSCAVKEHFSGIEGIPGTKFEVIYNGFSPVNGDGQTRKGEGSKGNVVGIVSNFNRPVKRVSDFVKTAALVKRQLPETKFMVVGGGILAADRLQQALVEESRELGLGDSIEFMGHVDNPLDYVRTFSVGVITSESEGFCNAIIEYMSCGVPVVVTDVGGNPELVRSGENGFLVPHSHPDEMAKKIIFLLENPELRSRMGSDNRERISREFTMEKMVRSHEHYYDSILQREEEWG